MLFLPTIYFCAFLECFVKSFKIPSRWFQSLKWISITCVFHYLSVWLWQASTFGRSSGMLQLFLPAILETGKIKTHLVRIPLSFQETVLPNKIQTEVQRGVREDFYFFLVKWHILHTPYVPVSPPSLHCHPLSSFHSCCRCCCCLEWSYDDWNCSSHLVIAGGDSHKSQKFQLLSSEIAELNTSNCLPLGFLLHETRKSSLLWIAVHDFFLLLVTD